MNYKSKAGRALMAANRAAREERNDRIVSLYIAGTMFCTEIARVVGVENQLVHDVLKKRGIPKSKRQRIDLSCPFVCDFKTDYLEI